MSADRLDPELVAAVDTTREAIARVLGDQPRDPHACDHAHRRYAAACAAAGVRTPPPWQDWPAPGPRRITQTSGRLTAGDERNNA